MTSVVRQSRRALFGGTSHGASGQPLAARIGRTCLAYRDIVCQACGDACEPRAIRFCARAGGPAWPLILPSTCNACGACAEVCPAGAISVAQAPGA